LQTWLAPRRPGDFNQALMDLGSSICTARAPQCLRCPLRPLCATRGEAMAGPQRPPPVKLRPAYLLALRRGRVLLVRRPESARQLAGLWELPAAPARRGARLGEVLHRITRFAVTAQIFAPPPRWRARQGELLALAEARGAPLTGLCRKALGRYAPE
ncbi:MAG: A/G-specific adenine glycosylase, partial [Terriglobales bacterium]